MGMPSAMSPKSLLCAPSTRLFAFRLERQVRAGVVKYRYCSDSSRSNNQ